MRNNEKLTVRIRFVLSASLLVISFLVLLFSTRSLTGVPERIGISIISFFQTGFSRVSLFISRSIASISELRILEQKYEELLARTDQLRLIERDFSIIKNENIALKEQLGFSADLSYEHVAAQIIGKDPSNLYSSFVLNKGIQDGITKNSIVIAYQDGIEGLVGRVIEVSPHACHVLPIYDASAFIAIRLQQSRYEGLIVGQGTNNQNLLARYIKKRALPTLGFGDLIDTSGLQSIYPSGLMVGRVMNIIDLPYMTSLELEVEPVIDFDRLEYVFIITGSAAISTEFRGDQ